MKPANEIAFVFFPRLLDPRVSIVSFLVYAPLSFSLLFFPIFFFFVFLFFLFYFLYASIIFYEIDLLTRVQEERTRGVFSHALIYTLLD